jgi:hypothetical protein
VHVLYLQIRAGHLENGLKIARVPKSGRKNEKGDKKKLSQNSTLRPKLHFDATKLPVWQYMSCKTALLAAKSQLLQFGCF